MATPSYREIQEQARGALASAQGAVSQIATLLRALEPLVQQEEQNSARSGSGGRRILGSKEPVTGGG